MQRSRITHPFKAKRGTRTAYNFFPSTCPTNTVRSENAYKNRLSKLGHSMTGVSGLGENDHYNPPIALFALLRAPVHDIDFFSAGKLRQACRNIQANYSSLHIRVIMQDARESSCEFRGKSCAMCSETTPSRTRTYRHCRMVHEPSGMICPRLETALLMTENKFRQMEWKTKCLRLHSLRNTRQKYALSLRQCPERVQGLALYDTISTSC